MDCKVARLLLEFARPGDRELDRDEAEVLRQHLTDCPDCAALAQAERHLDEHLGRAMRDVPVPTGLRERLLQKLAVERDAWYRKWLVRVAGAAAGLLLAAWLGYAWWSSLHPALDVRAVHELANAQPLSTAKEVEAGFKAMNVTTVAHPELNYQVLDSYGLALLQGQRVPHLLFLSQNEGGRPVLAHVYILSSQQFNLEETRQRGMAFVSGSRLVKLLDHPENADYLYLVVYTGDSLEPFKPKRPAIN